MRETVLRKWVYVWHKCVLCVCVCEPLMLLHVCVCVNVFRARVMNFATAHANTKKIAPLPSGSLMPALHCATYSIYNIMNVQSWLVTKNRGFVSNN